MSFRKMSSWAASEDDFFSLLLLLSFSWAAVCRRIVHLHSVSRHFFLLSFFLPPSHFRFIFFFSLIFLELHYKVCVLGLRPNLNEKVSCRATIRCLCVCICEFCFCLYFVLLHFGVKAYIHLFRNLFMSDAILASAKSSTTSFHLSFCFSFPTSIHILHGSFPGWQSFFENSS